jgi:hypothetical protein
VLLGREPALGVAGKPDAHIFAPAFFLPVRKPGPDLEGRRRLKALPGQARHERAPEEREGDERRDRVAGSPMKGVPATIPIATGGRA